MSEKQIDQTLPKGVGVSQPASAGTPADVEGRPDALRNLFWQGALASSSLLLWIVTNLNTLDFPTL